MKKVTVGFKREEYGFVEIVVPNGCSEEEILTLAQDAESNGMCNWGDENTECTGIIDESVEED